MELLYIWIDSYKNIKQKGFNFSPKYRFDFVPTTNDNNEVIGGDLTCTENDFSDNFFGEGISNVTAIIGQNGSGKSSLLEFICKSYQSQYIIALNHGNLETYLLSNIKFNNLTLFRHDRIDGFNFFQNSFYYYSNAINLTQYPLCKKDISTSFLIQNDIISTTQENNREPIETPIGEISAYHRKEVNRQLNFFCSLPSYLPFNTPKYISLSIFTNFISNNRHEFAQQKRRLRIDDNIIGVNDFINYIVFYEAMQECSLRFSEVRGEMEYNVFENYLSKFIDTTKLAIKKFDTLLHVLENEISFEQEKLVINIFQAINLIETFYSCNLKYVALNYDWDVVFSDGEQNLIKLFSRLYYFHEKIETNIILIDEGELGLHPQWQKEYLKNLIEVLPQIFKDKQIQIILTSHSPFLVSDLPKENIIFLEKDKETGRCLVKNSLNDMKQTFGANIHTLLTDSFFMHDKGLMGKFAEGKINDVILWLNDGSNKNITKLAKEQNGTETQAEKELKLVQWLIKQIGEPIIRNQLQKMLDSRRLEKVETHDEQIRKLESIVSTMQKHIEELRNKK